MTLSERLVALVKSAVYLELEARRAGQSAAAAHLHRAIEALVKNLKTRREES